MARATSTPTRSSSIPRTANHHLSPGSPAIDAGDNLALPPDDFDLDGDGDTVEPLPLDLDALARRVDDPFTEDTGNGDAPIVDMGPYEYQGCPADVNADGQLNILDFIAFQLLWQGQDEAADCNADGVLDVLDFVCFRASSKTAATDSSTGRGPARPRPVSRHDGRCGNSNHVVSATNGTGYEICWRKTRNLDRSQPDRAKTSPIISGYPGASPVARSSIPQPARLHRHVHAVEVRELAGLAHLRRRQSVQTRLDHRLHAGVHVLVQDHVFDQHPRRHARKARVALLGDVTFSIPAPQPTSDHPDAQRHRLVHARLVALEHQQAILPALHPSHRRIGSEQKGVNSSDDGSIVSGAPSRDTIVPSPGG